MVELAFDCLDVQPDRFAAVPTLLFKLRIAELSGETVHAIALRCQIRIEPFKRRYSPEEEARVLDLFGERSRWGETLKPMQFAFVDQMVPGFEGSAEVDLPVACTYDFEVASAKYFASLQEGEIPLLLLFSGTVFTKGETGFAIHRVPWDKEAECRLPVAVWRQLMDLFFPNSAWIRLRRDTFDALHVFKSRLALPTWDDVLERLLKEAEAGEEGRAS
jgi:hypothetical protein